MSRRKISCDGCGCNCKNCSDTVGSLHLHVEIENLKQKLLEKENHIVSMETNFLREAEKFPNGEMAALTDELLTWQDKYSRLYESHKRVQKVNQNLEDKLLRIVDKCETEKNLLTAEVATLTRRLVDEKFNVSKLQEENERYRNDVNLAIQLLQCKPSNFIPQKYDSLPTDLQQKVRNYVTGKRRMSVSDSQQKQPEMKTIKVPIPTFPPTAMVYSVNKLSGDKDSSSGNSSNNNGEEKTSKHGTVDIVSAAIMAKVLEERERERSHMKHCDTCTCSTTNSNNSDNSTYNNNNREKLNKETQTTNEYTSNNNLLLYESVISNSIEADCNSTLVEINKLKGNCLISHNSNVLSSSPMNIKRKTVSNANTNVNTNTNTNYISSTCVPVSVVSTPEKETETDLFSEFEVSPLTDLNSKNNVNVSCSNSVKNALNNHQNVNKCLSEHDLLSMSCNQKNNDETLTLSRNSKIALKNNKNHINSSSISSNINSTTGNSNRVCIGSKIVSNQNMDNDDNDNLIVFDQPVQCPTAASVSTAVPTSPPALPVPGNNTAGNKCGTGRQCSVRLQAGTSNILLDNVVDGPYAPVLYKSRPQSSFDPLLVHVPLTRSMSTSSSISSICNDDQSRLLSSDSKVNSSSNNITVNKNVSQSLSSSSSSTYSNSSSSSTPSSSLSVSSSSLRKSLTFAQIRTETEI